MQMGDFKKAIHILEPLVKENPLDQSCLYAYGMALFENGDHDNADLIFINTIEVAPHTNFAALAKEERSKIAHKKFKKQSLGDLRMDAVMYLLDALEIYDSANVNQQLAIFHEVSMIGMSGLDIDGAERKYRLKTVPGKVLTGIHMICYMWEGCKRFIPQQDMQFDLSKEYEAAKAMYKMTKKKI